MHDEGYIQAEGKVLNMYYFSFPVVTDWNEDGLLDIIVTGNGPSKKQCNLPIYLNKGTETTYKFEAPLVHKEDGGLGLPFMEPRIAPQVIDLDGDGKKDLIIGKNSYQPFAGMDFYRNIGTNAVPELADPVPILDINGSGDWAPNATGGKDEAECHPTFADWNGDGILDIIIGGESGWNNLHISYGDTSGVSVLGKKNLSTPKQFGVSVEKSNIFFSNRSSGPLTFIVHDLSGRLLYEKDVMTGITQSIVLKSAVKVAILSVRSGNRIVSNEMILLQ